MVNVEHLSEEQDDSKGSEVPVMTDVFLQVAKTVVGSLLYVVILASVVTVLFIVILCIYNGLRTIIHVKSRTGEPSDDKFDNAIKQPIVIFVITLGILSFFFILPFLVGEQEKGNLLGTWIDGVLKIDNLFDFNENTIEGESVVTWPLLSMQWKKFLAKMIHKKIGILRLQLLRMQKQILRAGWRVYKII